jgi:hypothetical protein
MPCHRTKEDGAHWILDPSDPWQRTGGGEAPSCTGEGATPGGPSRSGGGAPPSRAITRRRRGLAGPSCIDFEGGHCCSVAMQRGEKSSIVALPLSSVAKMEHLLRCLLEMDVMHIVFLPSYI